MIDSNNFIDAYVKITKSYLRESILRKSIESQIFYLGK